MFPAAVGVCRGGVSLDCCRRCGSHCGGSLALGHER